MARGPLESENHTDSTVHMGPAGVVRSMMDASNRSERSLTVPPTLGLVQTRKPFTGSTSKQELIRRNWIPAPASSPLIQVLFFTVWFRPYSDSLGHTKRPFVTVCGGFLEDQVM